MYAGEDSCSHVVGETSILNEVRIEKWVYGGDALARVDGRVVLAPFTLPGELARVDVGEDVHARLVDVMEPAGERVAAPCPHFGKCGGCHYQHAPYKFQLARKVEILREQLRRVGKIDYQGEIEVLSGAAFGTVVARGGEPFSLIEGGASEARAHFTMQQVNPAKGIVIGAGGRGYDDTFSQMLRLSLGAVKAVRKSGDILLVGECREGLGSDALQMQATGRVSDSALRKGFYADGMEEIAYLGLLKENYSVTFLSSLPELYAGGSFRFRTAKNSGAALQKVFNSTGRGAKLHVFTRAPETYLG